MRTPLFLDPFVWRMAWRDSRASRRRLALFVAAMITGVAALVSIGSFATNLEHALSLQAKALLGADLRLQSRKPPDEECEALVTSLVEETGGDTARQISFASMALFARADATRLVRVRAVEGGYPFYGGLVTEPAGAGSALAAGAGALVEQVLLLEVGA